MRRGLVTAMLILFWPIFMLIAIGRPGKWNVPQAVFSGMFHVAMVAAILYAAGVL